MVHGLSRLKRGSAAASAPSAGVDVDGQRLPPSYHNDTSSSQASMSTSASEHARLSMAEKTLPPGAAAYTHPPTQWNQAQNERDELERAIKLSEEQDQYEAALRASQQAEEQENLRREQELQAEDAILRASQADHEAHEDQVAIAQAEEEQAILAAIRASEREAEIAAKRKAAKGKQTQRDITPINSGNQSSGTSILPGHQAGGNSVGNANAGDNEDDDEDVRQAMELSMRDQDEERQEQEQIFQTAQRNRQNNPSIAQASTSAIHNPSENASRLQPSSVSHAPPPLPRRHLQEDQDYESIAEAPPAYEPPPPSSTSNNNGPSPAPSSEAATFNTADTATSTALAEAEALEEKRLVFYPPVATSEMAEGSMRAFVPHMLFAARRRERSDPDEWFPMASRDVDLSRLPNQPRLPSISSPTSPASPSGPPKTATRPRRPLPPLPALQTSDRVLHPSALSQFDQKISTIVSPSSYYTAAAPSFVTNASGAAPPSTTQAVENEDYDDPFDDSQAALTDDDSYDGPASDTDDHYNVIPSSTMNSAHPGFGADEDDIDRRSQMNNISHASASIREAPEREQSRSKEAAASESPVGRYDYARAPAGYTSGQQDGLPRAISPEPQNTASIVQGQQQELALNEGYASAGSAMSWESTGSEDEGVPYQKNRDAPVDESAQDINTNISFGFNPLSSPNKHLDWQGRFPDLIVLSRFADTDTGAGARGESSSQASANVKEDYRTFAFEAPTWRELLAYLMWHGNSLFEAAEKDKRSSNPDSLKVSLIVEFVKTANPPSTLVRLQIHLLSTSADPSSDSSLQGTSARGVALSRKPLSSRPSNYVTSSLPCQGSRANDSTHLVLAFPKPYHSLPFSLGTIGTHLHNAHKAAVAQRTQQVDHRIQLGPQGRINNTQFLTDLLRGIDMCTDKTVDSADAKQKGRQGVATASSSNDGHASPDDSRFDKFVGRLKDKRHSMRGTLRELHKSSRRKRRHRKQAKEQGKGNLNGAAEDSDESYLESRPQAEDYHITPYPVGT